MAYAMSSGSTGVSADASFSTLKTKGWNRKSSSYQSRTR